MPLNKEMVDWILSELNTRPVMPMNGAQSEQHAVASIMVKKELTALFPDEPVAQPDLSVVPRKAEMPDPEPGEEQVG